MCVEQFSPPLLPLNGAVLSIRSSCSFLCASAFSCSHRSETTASSYVRLSGASSLHVRVFNLVMGQKTCSVFHSSRFHSNTWNTLNSFASRSQFWLGVNNEREWEDRSERWMNKSWREKSDGMEKTSSAQWDSLLLYGLLSQKFGFYHIKTWMRVICW